ncbi:16S rRNA (cytosine(1402)-N(4))-methyltransferase RsmH [Candidatus Parcubacteria bacterium]|nr:16S rRNA (cytosine(1402)-N(4))-methyltransferase RsmH [Candidatus Parcubacteria bacterium]
MHTPVLLNESLEMLALKGGDVFVDGTIGSGGHSAEVAKRFGDDIEIVGIDRDRDALARSEERLRTLTHSSYLKLASFKDLGKVLDGLGISRASAILLDLGISSNQIEESGRGFSFQRDEPLMMTMSKEKDELNARHILNTWDESTLEVVIRGFGEEKYSRKIAHEIVTRRDKRPFERTGDLVDAVMAATPERYHHGKTHPATRTFQAIRIAVNEELTVLEEGLKEGFRVLAPGGRLAVISFHSLEDRIVKNFFKDLAQKNLGKLITKKPVTPSEAEVKGNPRSRSAKLRAIEKI